jgi:hypothetical protein
MDFQAASSMDWTINQLVPYLESLEDRLGTLYSRLVLAVIAGFCAAFIMFLTYTVVFEVLKLRQIEHYTNMTMEERLEKEKYRVETEEMRESLIHRSYDEVREKGDVLKECQKDLSVLREQLSYSENELYRLKIEAREVEGILNVKLETLRKVVDELKSSNERMTEDLGRVRELKDRYDYSVLGGLFCCLLAIIYLLRNKYY